ncbi:hypothetical protein MPL1032_250119 [Mesorhizobium plurifarium]|uniref:Uncharacterized protein n=1 Tax=Mesorhizobium plurifarium TaxID=69974 RepID=A0A0K2W248_MESPL|nr:hypothetical protein MPL1032_250119 [Mesorhizobium plurifarium]
MVVLATLSPRLRKQMLARHSQTRSPDARRSRWFRRVPEGVESAGTTRPPCVLPKTDRLYDTVLRFP